MTALTRKAGAPVAEDTAFHSPVVLREARYDTDHDALEGMTLTSQEREKIALWERRNAPLKVFNGVEIYEEDDGPAFGAAGWFVVALILAAVCIAAGLFMGAR